MKKEARPAFSPEGKDRLTSPPWQTKEDRRPGNPPTVGKKKPERARSPPPKKKKKNPLPKKKMRKKGEGGGVSIPQKLTMKKRGVRPLGVRYWL